MEYARDTLGVTDITLNVYPDNLVAIRCYQRSGFVFTGAGSSLPGAGVEMRYRPVEV